MKVRLAIHRKVVLMDREHWLREGPVQLTVKVVSSSACKDIFSVVFDVDPQMLRDILVVGAIWV